MNCVFERLDFLSTRRPSYVEHIGRSGRCKPGPETNSLEIVFDDMQEEKRTGYNFACFADHNIRLKECVQISRTLQTSRHDKLLRRLVGRQEENIWVHRFLPDM